MADQLTTLGEAVRESSLVLNILRRLNNRYTHMASFIKRQRPMPDYDDLLADLKLKEITILSKQGSQALAPTAPRASAPTSSSVCWYAKWRSKGSLSTPNTEKKYAK